MNFSNRISQAGGLLLLAGFAIPAFAQIPPTPVLNRPDAAGATPSAPPIPVVIPLQTVDGIVDAWNFDPRGRLNSVVVKTTDGKLDQFNLPPDFCELAMRIAADGKRVTAVGSPERLIGDRTIFRLSKLTDVDGKRSMTTPTPGVPEPTEIIKGTVQRLNVSPRGEVDGAVLDSGDYVHTGPEAAVGLTVGGELSVAGIARPMADGHRAIEASTVNGQAVLRPPMPVPGRRPGPGGNPPPAPLPLDAVPPAPPR